MHCFVGLGNPGRQYEGTRHNAGFMVLDEIASRLKIRFREGKGEYFIAETDYAGDSVLLVKPTTHMNASGIAVREVVDAAQIDLKNLVVVCDDFNLPLGTVRLREQGSDGGHNGLASIIYHLESDAFPRLRLGTAGVAMPQDRSKMANFVLERFAHNEAELLNEMVLRAADACLEIPVEGLSRTMSEYNQKQIPDADSETQ